MVIDLQVGILADDLSGALNIGVEFAATGLKTAVIQGFAGDKLPPKDADVLIIDTETRNVAFDVAFDNVGKTALALRELEPAWVVKKLDSLLRGSISAELEAIMEAFAFDSCLLCAASPKLGRQTIGGYHIIDGVPLAQKLAELDPTSTLDSTGAVSSSAVPEILAAQSTRPVMHLTLDQIEQDGAKVVAALQTLHGSIIVADCCQQQDLNRVVAAAAEAGIRFFAGTYGLGEALRGILEPPPHPVLVVIGSLSEASTRQVNRLVQDEGCALVEVAYDESFLSGDLAAFAQPYLEQLQAAGGRDTVLKVSSAQAQQLWDWAAHHEQPQTTVSQRVDALLQHLLMPILSEYDCIIASGGSTAAAVFQLLGAEGLRLGEQEVIAGVPSSIISGGPHAGKLFIAKPGSQGTDSALVDLVRFARYAALRT